ncbi:uncharacterized protein ABDE67_017924 [Symphorus nematophorus]
MIQRSKNFRGAEFYIQYGPLQDDTMQHALKTQHAVPLTWMSTCGGDQLMVWLPSVLALVVALSAAQSNTKTLTETAGRNVTLHTGVAGLRGSYHIIWSYGDRDRVLLEFVDGKLVRSESQRFHLDPSSGSLTIRNLSINDSGSYRGRIFNGNGSTHRFDLNVVEPDPTQLPAEGSDDPADKQKKKTYLAVGLSLGALVVLVVTGLIVYAVKKTNGNFCPSDVGL